MTISPHELEKLPTILRDLTSLQEIQTPRRRGGFWFLEFEGWDQRFRFVVALAEEGTLGPIQKALRELERFVQAEPEWFPLVVSPFTRPAGQRACEADGISWMDLSGNAWIRVPHLCLTSRGQENQYPRRGRPANLFAPKSSRVLKVLLSDPSRSFSQRELATVTGVTDPLVSRVVRRLLKLGLVKRDASRRVSVSRPGELLQAWREAYDFSQHRIVRGHLPGLRDPDLDAKGWGQVLASSGEYLFRVLARQLSAQGIPYAATGLGAAWLYDRFAAFQTVTLYLPEEPFRGRGLSPSVRKALARLGWQDGGDSGNIWLVAPRDPGVLDDTVPETGDSRDSWIRRVGPLQVYLDLEGHPERSEEAAEHLRGSYLRELSHG